MRKTMKALVIFAVVLAMALPVFAGGEGESTTSTQLSPVQEIIKQAEGMTMEELAQKAIEESNGKMFYGVGNSSRGKTALPLFISWLQTFDPSYTLNYEWQQPKNNKIFDQLTADSLKDQGTFAMTLIQDGNQIESKMVRTGILDTFIPKEWAEANGTTAEEYTGYLPLQTLNKVFMYNNTGSKTYDNVWDFVAPGEHGLFMDIDSEIVGKNFLYMLTADQYATTTPSATVRRPSSSPRSTKSHPTPPTSDSARTASMPLHGSSSGSRATTPRPMTDPSATRSWPLPQPTSSDFWSTPSSEASRSQRPSPRRTSTSQPTTTAIRDSEATATATTSSSPTTRRFPGPPVRSSPTWSTRQTASPHGARTSAAIRPTRTSRQRPRPSTSTRPVEWQRTA